VSGRSIDLTIADKRRLFQGQGFITTSQLNQAAVDEALARRSNYSNRRAASKQGKLVGDAKTRHLRGEQKLGDKYHDGCHCVAVAVRLGESYEPPDYVGQWEQDYSAAVRATQAEGKTKGEYGAIDVTAVLNHMDRASRN
jgi:hypothetical protein